MAILNQMILSDSRHWQHCMIVLVKFYIRGVS